MSNNNALFRSIPTGAAVSALAQSINNRQPVLVSAQLTRPADTTAYAVGDVIYPVAPAAPGIQVASLKFANAIPFGGASSIVGAQLKMRSAQSTKLSAKLHLFSAPIAAVPADNAPFVLTAADLAKHLQTITFTNGIAEDLGGYTAYDVAGLIKNVSLPEDAVDLHGYLVTQNAYVPVSGEVISVHLGLLANASIL